MFVVDLLLPGFPISATAVCHMHTYINITVSVSVHLSLCICCYCCYWQLSVQPNLSATLKVNTSNPLYSTVKLPYRVAGYLACLVLSIWLSPNSSSTSKSLFIQLIKKQFVVWTSERATQLVVWVYSSCGCVWDCKCKFVSMCNSFLALALSLLPFAVMYGSV